MQGAEISGALSTLCDRLADERVAVLNMCTLSRNFMLVREEAEERALATLRATIQPPEGAADGTAGDAASATAGGGQDLASRGTGGGRARASVPRGVQLEMLKAPVCIGMVSVQNLKLAAHALLSLLFLQDPRARHRRPSFAHYFEMGGEVSLILDEGALGALAAREPQSHRALVEGFGSTLSREWRVLSVTCAAGSDGVGILSAVCLPLASLPLLNVSTLDHTFVLVREADVEEALQLLRRAGFELELE